MDVKPRSSPTLVVVASLAFTVTLARGLAFAAVGDQDLSQTIASGARTLAVSIAPAASTSLAPDDGETAVLKWPQPSSWPVSLTSPVTLGGGAAQAAPRGLREPADGHGFAKALAGTTTGMFVLLQGVDIAQTMQCVGAASCREANPFLRSLAREPAAFGATKMAIAFVSGYTLFHASGRHPKLVTALSIAGIGLYATITYRQAHLDRR